MKNYLQILLLCIFFVHANAQSSVTLDWVKTTGGTDDESTFSIYRDNAGNVYTTGFFNGTVDFDPGVGIYNLTGINTGDVFVTKSDSNGNFIWAKQFGGVNIEEGFSVEVDQNGNVYTTGQFFNTVDFDPGLGVYNLTSNGISDCFISKLDMNGNFVWAKQIGGVDYDYANKLTVDNFGNVYVIGTFIGSVDFNPGAGTYNLTSSGGNDIFLVKLSSSGIFIWANKYGGIGNDIGYDIERNANTLNIFITGYFNDTADLDPTVNTYNLISKGGSDAFVAKLNSTGNVIWAKAFGGANFNDEGLAIAADGLENVYVGGTFGDTVDFDPGISIANRISNGMQDAFIVKLDATGNYVYAKTFGGIGHDDIASLVIDNHYNLYAGGAFYNAADLDPGPAVSNFASNGIYDIYISKFDSLGNFQWAIQNGSSLADALLQLVVDANYNIYYTGYYRDSLDFDPSSSGVTMGYNANPGPADFFIAKLKQCNTSNTFLTQTACNSYVFNGQVLTSSGIYTMIQTNTAGCDSVITLNLTINNVISSIVQNSNILTATTAGATYQWLQCPAFSPIFGATNQSYTVSANGNYAAVVTQGACSDTSNCLNVIGVGVSNINNIESIVVSPNPANSTLNLYVKQGLSNATVRIFNLIGECILEKTNVVGNIFNIDISHLSKGIYAIELIEKDRKLVQKFAKE